MTKSKGAVPHTRKTRTWSRCAALILALAASLAMTSGTRSYPERAPRMAAASPQVQRTLQWLADLHGPRRKVRVLFYGQSFSEQGWWRDLAGDLRRKYPQADLEIENRALGGFPSQLLVKTAESDVFPYYPDLIVLHAFGAHDRYEELVRAIRTRTTAEIMIQNDYVIYASQLTPPQHPERLVPDGKRWDAFMNYRFLPDVARAYGAALCDHREDFQTYLRSHALAPDALLIPDGHLNSFGEWLIHQGARDCLRALPLESAQSTTPPSAGWIRDHRMGHELGPKNGRLRLLFRGNRVDALLGVGGTRPARVWIDDRPPSENPDLYAFGRALASPGGKWPAILRVRSRTLPLVERWTLDVQRGSEPGAYTFALHGSRSGFDGTGSSREAFVSNSGRVAIDPEDWNVEYALALSRITEAPARLSVRFDVHPLFTDEIEPRLDVDDTHEKAVTLAQGLSNDWHVVEVEAGPNLAVVAALRVYEPPHLTAHAKHSGSDAM